MPYRNGNKVQNATEWTAQMISSLKENFGNKTNQQLADMLGVGLTVLRNKTRELGLKKFQIEYWNDEMVRFLKDNYKTMGDVEIMQVFKSKFPKIKGWKRNAINKKRKQLGLHRTTEEFTAIIHKNCAPGGPSHTIPKNSSSLNMHDSWVAVTLARTNSGLRNELLKHPEIIDAKRAILKLKRAIKNISDAKKKS